MDLNVLFAGANLRQRRRETILNPPTGINFITQFPLEEMKADYDLSKVYHSRFNELALKVVRGLKLPNIKYIHNQQLKNIDLIYSPGFFLLKPTRNYVVEIENQAALGFYLMSTVYSKTGQFLIRRFSKQKKLKHFICISNAAKQGIINLYKDKVFEEKCKVVNPYVKINPYPKTLGDDKIRLLFCATNFYVKGGRHVLEAFEQLNKRDDNLELWLITKTEEIEPQLLNKYKAYHNIKFIEPSFTKEELYKQIYANVDILIHPTFWDSQAMSVMEAVASGLPIVTTDTFAIPGFVKDGYNGFLIEPPIRYFNKDYTPNQDWWDMDHIRYFAKTGITDDFVNKLVSKLDKLILDDKLRKEMSRNSKLLIETEFSEKNRLSQLKRIFEDSI